VKIIAGEHRPDSGEIRLHGQSYAELDPIRARGLGIQMIYQELSDAPDLSVAENISLGRLPARRGIVSWHRARLYAERVRRSWASQSMCALGRDH
jgi:ribose transport system ATP-binding protein